MRLSPRAKRAKADLVNLSPPPFFCRQAEKEDPARLGPRPRRLLDRREHLTPSFGGGRLPPAE